MTDTRTRVPLTKAIDLAQLSAEVGVPLAASDTEVVTADPDQLVTAERLQSALDAHVPIPEVDAEAEFRAALGAATTVAQLRDALLGRTGPGAEPRRGSDR